MEIGLISNISRGDRRMLITQHKITTATKRLPQQRERAFLSTFHLDVAISGTSIFSARQHICCSALYAIVRPSVGPPVCHTGGSVKDG